MRLGEVVEDVSMLEVSLVLERMLAGVQEIDRWIDTVIYSCLHRYLPILLLSTYLHDRTRISLEMMTEDGAGVWRLVDTQPVIRSFTNIEISTKGLISTKSTVMLWVINQS